MPLLGCGSGVARTEAAISRSWATDKRSSLSHYTLGAGKPTFCLCLNVGVKFTLLPTESLCPSLRLHTKVCKREHWERSDPCSLREEWAPKSAAAFGGLFPSCWAWIEIKGDHLRHSADYSMAGWFGEHADLLWGMESFLPFLSVCILLPDIFPDWQGNDAYGNISDAAVAAEKLRAIPQESDFYSFIHLSIYLLNAGSGVWYMQCHENLCFPKKLNY